MKEWFEDNILFYVKKCKYKILRFFDRLKIWFSYWTPVKGVYDFDWSGMYIVQRHQIERMIKAITKYQHHVYWKEDIRYMKIALHCLDIILNNKDYYKIDGSMSICDDELIPDYTFTIDRYVNTKNGDRFLNPKLRNFKDGLYEVNLYEAKAWSLYNKLLKEKSRGWWD